MCGPDYGVGSWVLPVDSPASFHAARNKDPTASMAEIFKDQRLTHSETHFGIQLNKETRIHKMLAGKSYLLLIYHATMV